MSKKVVEKGPRRDPRKAHRHKKGDRKDKRSLPDYFNKNDIMSDYYFVYEQPAFPAVAKMINIEMSPDLDYKMSDPELLRSRLLHYTNPLLNMNLAQDIVYEAKPKKNMEFTKEENELAEFCLSYNSKKPGQNENTFSKDDSSYNFESIYGTEGDGSFRSLKQKFKNDKDAPSRLQN